MLKCFAAAGTLTPFATCSNAWRIRSSLLPAVVAAEVDAIAAPSRLSWSVTAAAGIANEVQVGTELLLYRRRRTVWSGT